MSHPDYVDIGEPETLVMEECAELIHAICKAQRFGWFNHHPRWNPSYTNVKAVLEEIGDVRVALNKLEKILLEMKEPPDAPS